MKKTLALAILGVAAATTAFGQGHVLVSNYLVSPYNQVVFEGAGLTDAAVQFQLFFGPAGESNPANVSQVGSTAFGVNPSLTYDPGAGFGGGGYFDAQVLLTPAPGDYSAVVRTVSPGYFGESAIFAVTTISTSLPADTAPVSPGFVVVVPEPTTFALAGLGAAALLIFRRRA